MKVFIPADVPTNQHKTFADNYCAITKNTQKLLLFAADQKIEHLNTDFYGPGIDQAANDPRHIFAIAHQGHAGALATQLGLIARHSAQYLGINYIVKLNSRTNIGPSDQDPISQLLWTIEDVVTFKQASSLAIRGVGYTLYLGSEHEATMLAQAAQIINHAHRHGLLAILWVYPRGKFIKEQTAELFIGSAGAAHALGADFVKLHMAPHSNFDAITLAAQAAGNTKILCAGGAHTESTKFLQTTHNQLQHGAAGIAVGRNLFQRPLPEAIALSKKLAALIYEN